MQIYADGDLMMPMSHTGFSLGTVSVLSSLTERVNYRVRKEERVQGRGRKPSNPHTRQREREK